MTSHWQSMLERNRFVSALNEAFSPKNESRNNFSPRQNWGNTLDILLRLLFFK
jgi:hypothetical protein